MSPASFDPAGYFEFDLARGEVMSRASGRVLILPDSVVAPLVATAVGNGDLTAVRKLGRQLGEAVASEVEAGAEAPAEVVLTHAASILSIFGWGSLRIDRWGDALVAVLDDLPELDDDHLGSAALLGGLFSAVGRVEVACVPVSEEGVFLLVDPTVAQMVWRWARSGEELASIVGRLEPSEAR